MSDAEPAVKLERLRRLLADFSFAEKRRPGMLAEIDALLRWATAEMVRPGAAPTEVEAMLGPPHGTVGDPSSGLHEWLYPSAASSAELAQAPQWFFSLRFKGGSLQSIERRGWTD